MTRTFPPIPPSLRLDTVCHPAGKPTPVRLLLLLHARRDNKRHMQSTCPMHRLLTHAPLQGSPCNSHKTLQHNREGHHSDTTSFVSFASRRQQNTTSAQKIRLPRLQDETQASGFPPAHNRVFVHLPQQHMQTRVSTDVHRKLHSPRQLFLPRFVTQTHAAEERDDVSPRISSFHVAHTRTHRSALVSKTSELQHFHKKELSNNSIFKV